MRSLWMGVAALAVALALFQPALAGECGTSCCIGAGGDVVKEQEGLTVTTQYERMIMKTLRQGSTEVSPTSVLQDALAGGRRSYSIPTRMVMQRYALNLSQRLSDREVLVLVLPYVVNDMDMRMAMRGMGGTVMARDVKMDTVSGLGDVSLSYLRDAYRDPSGPSRGRVTLGLGVKAPTGESQVRTSQGNLVHAMMQPGSGSWDLLLFANGAVGLGERTGGAPAVEILPAATWQITTANVLGYRAGSRLDLDVSTRVPVGEDFKLKLDLHGIFRGADSTDGTLDPRTGRVAYQNPEQSLIDNVDNTGITSVFVAPGFQWLPSEDVVVSGEWRLPLAQNARGLQQVTDEWQFLRVSFRL